ncbi:MAG: prefoldin subunit beta [Candidatus Aenigmarchaeota archaeon]|nr:prefoldin subunit beta [Candidatus Aenigmarchaeota archaeon]
MSELEDALNELQLHNQQLQTVMMQKQSLMIQDKEMEKALEEIEKSGGEEIFKSIGPILVKTSKEAIKKDLEEGREETELKVKALEKQEIRIKQKIKSMQERFQSLTQGGSGG